LNQALLFLKSTTAAINQARGDAEADVSSALRKKIAKHGSERVWKRSCALLA
jgi:hypothetical protein